MTAPVGLAELLAVVDDPQATTDLRNYFQPDLPEGVAPHYAGSRFEFIGGGGDRPETANQITLDDLVAVTLLEVHVPGDVALQLLEGSLGPDVARHLEQIPTDVSIGDPVAAQLFSTASHARVAWDLLEEPYGMGWVITNKLLARKRPRLIPVYDRVVRCAYGRPGGLWNWLSALFAENGGVLTERLLAAHEAAGLSPHITPLRVLDVIVWMRHGPHHLLSRCPRRL